MCPQGPQNDVGCFQGLRVLYAEDDPSTRVVFQEMLSELGCVVTAVADGAEGLERAQTESFDLLLLDWHMPELDGIEVAERLHAMAQRPQPPVIVLTARNRAQDLARSRAANVAALLVKPTPLARFARRVHEALKAHRDLQAEAP